MTPTAIDPFHSLSIIQQNPDSWGNFKYFPNELISQIFFWVMKGKTGATGFNRLMRLSQHVHAFCHWTTKYIPFPLTDEIKFNRTHLNKAAGKGSLESIQHLLKHKSIPPDTTYDLDILLEAIKNGQMETVQLLWKEERIQKVDLNPNNSLNNPFTVALRYSHLEIASWLWDTGRFTLNHTSTRHLFSNGNAQLINKVAGKMIKSNNAYDHMYLAIRIKSTEFIKVLLRKRVMLIDCMGPVLQKIAQIALIMIISNLAFAIFISLVAGGIVACVAGVAAVLKMILELSIVFGTVTVVTTSLILMVSSIVAIAHHLFILIRAAVLLSHHHLKQKISMARKI